MNGLKLAAAVLIFPTCAAHAEVVVSEAATDRHAVIATAAIHAEAQQKVNLLVRGPVVPPPAVVVSFSSTDQATATAAAIAVHLLPAHTASATSIAQITPSAPRTSGTPEHVPGTRPLAPHAPEFYAPDNNRPAAAPALYINEGAELWAKRTY